MMHGKGLSDLCWSADLLSVSLRKGGGIYPFTENKYSYLHFV